MARQGERTSGAVAERSAQDAFLPLAVHASEFPQAQRTVLLAALRARRLPGKLLYQSPAQAQRWLDYHVAWSPSRADPALEALYGEAAAAAARAPPPGPALVLGLGSGGGRKDAALLAVLAAQGPDAPLAYAPVDASPALVAEAALHVRERVPAAALHPLAADLAAAPALADWLERAAPGAGRVLTCYGMLPNQSPAGFPRWLAGLLRPGDVLLVSANLSPGGLAADAARIVAQYDNSPARAWYAGALAELGLPAEAYALAVAAQPMAPDAAGGAEGAWQVAVEAALRAPVALALHGETVHWAAGERVAVFHSLRYTSTGAEALLRGAGLRVAERWLGAGGEEGVFLCRAPDASHP